MNPQHIFANDLRGAAYIAARNLSPEAIKNQQHECHTCRLQEYLPAVLSIVAHERQRRKVSKQLRSVK